MDFSKFANDPFTSIGMGLLGGNYGRNSSEAFANAMRGGMLGMQQAGVTQARNAQTQRAQQQLGMQQAAAARKRKEDEALEQWLATLPVQEQALARGNPQLYMEQKKQQLQQQYATPAAPTPAPSDVRRFKYYQSLNPAEREEFLRVQRAQQYLNQGNQFGVPSMTNPTQLTGAVPINLKPGEEPVVKRQQAAAAAEGTAEGAAIVSYKDAMSRMPRLHSLASELSALGKKATYTKAGQAADTIARQTGMKVSPGAVARTEYVSKVDNEILPLLRATFGAQFTEKEGQSLKATLGDPDKHPDEKDAVLRSFIKTKVEDLKTQGRRIGVAAPGQGTGPAAAPGAGKVVDFNDLK